MSQRFSGGVIRGVPVVPNGPLDVGAAPGVWTLTEATYWTRRGLWPTVGVLAVESVFSTYLYTGNDSTLQINNGIDLAGNGGLVWIKTRSLAKPNRLWDTARGLNSLSSNTTGAQIANLTDRDLTSFNSNGFSLGMDYYDANPPSPMVSWTFREAPNFFDVVTFTSNSSGGASFDHNLGSTPGMVIIKCTSATESWWVWHRSLATNQYLVLNSTQAVSTTTPTITCTSTTVTLTSGWLVNNNANYVAYLYAHVPGSNGIIQCGSFTTDIGGNFSVSLGWEPQWVMVKRTDATQNWFTADTMRGFSQTQFNTINPNLLDAEAANTSNYIAPNATGFGSIGNQFLSGSSTYIYMAIRRGPMQTPTLGASVFAPVVYTGTNVDNRLVNTGILTDMFMGRVRSLTSTPSFVTGDRLRGNPYVATALTAAENTDADSLMTPTLGVGNAFSAMNGVGVGNDATANVNSNTTASNQLAYAFRRAPGFMDVVCYTGANTVGSDLTRITHNLGVVPELILVKSRSISNSWVVYSLSTGVNNYLTLNTTAGSTSNTGIWATTAPSATTFGVSNNGSTVNNGSGSTYVAYLFASAPGVSKVGSYTGNGSSQTINCAFTTGARFVLIKRTDSTGGWLVWDSARGIVAGNDPYLALNSTAAEVTSDDSVDTDNTGFVVNQVAASNINVNAATYIFLAIA